MGHFALISVIALDDVHIESMYAACIKNVLSLRVLAKFRLKSLFRYDNAVIAVNWLKKSY